MRCIWFSAWHQQAPCGSGRILEASDAFSCLGAAATGVRPDKRKVLDAMVALAVTHGHLGVLKMMLPFAKNCMAIKGAQLQACSITPGNGTPAAAACATWIVTSS